METANINVRVDRELKNSAEHLFSDLGLSMSAAITIFLKSAVNHNGIPFEIKRVPNSETKAALAEYENMKRDRVNYKRYDSFDELLNEALEDT